MVKLNTETATQKNTDKLLLHKLPEMLLVMIERCQKRVHQILM